VDVKLHAFFTSSTDGDEARSEADLDIVTNRKIYALTGDSN
jgi:hypothetical protein